MKPLPSADAVAPDRPAAEPRAAEAPAADLALLRQVPAFASLAPAVLADLARRSMPVRFAPGDRLMVQGAPGDHALAVLAGAVDVVSDRRDGQLLLARLAGPTLLGEVGVLAQLPRNATVVATAPTRALRIDRADLLAVCRLAPDALLSVIGNLGAQLQSLNGAIGLYAAGCEALGNDSFDVAILDDLKNPGGPLQGFAAAFERLAQSIARERSRRAEMASAALLQRAMLPADDAALPACRRAEVAGLMQPARNVGGDFYDIFMLDDDHLVLIIGDVCGKGVPACLFMCVIMTMLRLAARSAAGGEGVAATIERVNAMVCDQNPSAMFATAIFGVLDLATGRFDYVNCGHNPAFVMTRDGGCTQLPSGGIPLGIAPGRRFDAATIDLAPGDALFLFTDGVTESVDPGGAEFGEARLAEALARHRGHGAAGLVAAIAAEVAGFARGAEPFDDITCLAAIMAGAPGCAPARNRGGAALDA